NQNIGNDGSLHQVRLPALITWIVVLTEIGIWPAVETAIFDGSDVVWNQIVTQIVAFVHGGPKDIVHSGLPRQTFWVADTGSEDSSTGTVGIELHDCCSTAVFAGV